MKHVFTELAGVHLPAGPSGVRVRSRADSLRVKTRKPLVASDEEVAANPRSRSALMRVAVKLDA